MEHRLRTLTAGLLALFAIDRTNEVFGFVARPNPFPWQHVDVRRSGSSAQLVCRFPSPSPQPLAVRSSKVRSDGGDPDAAVVGAEDAGAAMSDEELLRTVTREQLEGLCRTLKLSTSGSMQDLLFRLRELAKTNLERQRQQRLERQRQKNDPDNPMEQYEIDDDDEEEEEEEEEPVFYIPLEDTGKTNATKSQRKGDTDPSITQEQIVTPPAPDEEPNERGERSVRVYSSAAQNDMTGVAAAQPGASAAVIDSLMSTAGVAAAEQPWDAAQQSRRGKATKEQEEQATAAIMELVDTLLGMTGLPAFAEMIEGGGVDGVSTRGRRALSKSAAQAMGFQPSKVPTQLLSATSQALRTNRGQILQEVMRQYEIQAIGQDGMAADDLENGGGHYKEVSKVRAFLEGYRRAEVRRIARETTKLLLDKLVSEGIGGLDMFLANMVRSSDDTSNAAGELNDSLLDYLNDAVRQQEKRVEKSAVRRVRTIQENIRIEDDSDSDTVNDLWKVSTDHEGKRIESLDPNDPNVKKVLEEEYSKFLDTPQAAMPIPDSGPEKLLLLLKLLRERVKAEAVFGQDEKGRNLRLLAYCLRLAPAERKNLILKDAGGSMDRLESFLELVRSSIEYGESTSYQLQPSKNPTLNVKQLKSILQLVEEIVEDAQSFKK